ncbi:MAG TPA: L-histidine N(alpha)-methyltransferase [Candidatus Sulfotelmatobacter sp.]|nr:L-histidine N(alpha)-methyltransferase [Candidatus Sulfotelmatobacter sp.]
MLTQAVATLPLSDLAHDVGEGLSKPGQKELPCRYFYDEIGSALFEVITHLPEYGLSRAGERLLRKYAPAIASQVAPPVVVTELGCGSGRNTRWLLEALSRKRHVTYCPIEISGAALAMCKRELDDVDSLSFVGFEREYLDGLVEVSALRRPQEQLLVLFLGSTIGNFSRLQGVQFLAQVRQNLIPGDLLLLATDLEKPVKQLLLAYDDPLGVTAAFNLNLLARLNRELGADFRLKQFRHLARYNDRERRIEMHLLSASEQTVVIPGAGLAVTLERGETIWTESSHKYNVAEVLHMGQQSGFRCDTQWLDEEWPFAHTLFIAE